MVTRSIVILSKPCSVMCLIFPVKERFQLFCPWIPERIA